MEQWQMMAKNEIWHYILLEKTDLYTLVIFSGDILANLIVLYPNRHMRKQLFKHLFASRVAII